MYLNFTVLVLTSLEHYSVVSLFLLFSPLKHIKKIYIKQGTQFVNFCAVSLKEIIKKEK